MSRKKLSKLKVHETPVQRHEGFLSRKGEAVTLVLFIVILGLMGFAMLSTFDDSGAGDMRPGKSGGPQGGNMGRWAADAMRGSL